MGKDRREVTRDIEPQDLIGIVVIGRNEGERLLLCLDSTISRGVPVVYVDSQSTDPSVIEANKRHVDTIILDSSLPLSAARARNEGFYHLIGKFPSIRFVQFIDADCELDVDWLENAVKTFEEQINIAVVCGRLREKYRNTSVYMRLCDMDWYRPSGIIDACGGIAIYRREIFEKLSGFNASLIAGEEAELCSRIRAGGWNILCINEEMGTHDSAMLHFSQWWVRCVKVGFGYINGLDWNGESKRYKSALFWAVILPCAGLFGLFFNGWLSCLIFLLYPIQGYRIFKNIKRQDLSVYDRFIYSVSCLLSKFPETQGVLRYFRSKIFNQTNIIQYK